MIELPPGDEVGGPQPRGAGAIPAHQEYPSVALYNGRMNLPHGRASVPKQALELVLLGRNFRRPISC